MTCWKNLTRKQTYTILEWYKYPCDGVHKRGKMVNKVTKEQKKKQKVENEGEGALHESLKIVGNQDA